MVRKRINVREFLGSSTPRAVGGRTRDPAANPAVQAIWEAVAMIPAGKVSTYGDVARLAGFPGRPRQTGYALRVLPPHMPLPWHRVLGAGGRIVFPKSSANYREQARRLRAEGVKVTAGRVDPAALLEV
jgi:methylated-DNA-protein-cysteine methyltransferase related protein